MPILAKAFSFLPFRQKQGSILGHLLPVETRFIASPQTGARGRIICLFFLAIICGLGLTSCGDGDDQELDDDQLAWVQNGIACYYYNPEASDLGQGKSPGGKFKYAKTPDKFKIGGSTWGNYEVWPDGDMEDGFYVIKKIRVWSLLKGYKNITEDRYEIQKLLEDFCLKIVQKDNKKNLVHDIVITKNSSRSRHPIAFPSQKKDGGIGRVSRIVIFGDSLSDIGNMRRKLGWVGFLSPPYWLGRFADGPNWTDHLSKRLNLAMLNFATGGAVAAKVNDAKIKNLKSYVEIGGQLIISGSTDDQIDSYIKSLSKSSLFGGRHVKNPNETLYVLWAGANDYVSKIDKKDTLKTFIKEPNNPGGYTWTTIQTTTFIKNQIEKLYDVGARNFLIVNLPDLGATPTIVHNKDKYNQQSRADQWFANGRENISLISKTFTTVSEQHDLKLGEILQALKSRTKDDINIAYLDVKKELGIMVAENRDPDGGSLSLTYGMSTPFEYAEERNIGSPKIGKACYVDKKGYMGSKNFNKTKCKNRLYFDYVHPTSFAHCWLSYMIQKQLASTHKFLPDPGTLKNHKKICVGMSDSCPYVMPSRTQTPDQPCPD